MAYFDNRWHHLAVSFENVRENDADATRLKFYHDYKLVKTQTVAGKRWGGELVSRRRFQFGINSNPFEFSVDEFHFHQGAVGVESFLKREKLGFLLMYR